MDADDTDPKDVAELGGYPEWVLGDRDGSIFVIHEENGERSLVVFSDRCHAINYSKRLEHPLDWFPCRVKLEDMEEASCAAGFLWHWDGEKFRAIEL